MTDPTVTAALIGLIGVETAAIITVVVRMLWNNKHKNNPGHDVVALLSAINTKLDRLNPIEEKLDKLLRR